VWTCDFHYSGDFLVSGAMDNTLKVWDLNTLRCRQTMRGHTDSVNCVRFQVS
jgi:WD40 repeat protein